MKKTKQEVLEVAKRIVNLFIHYESSGGITFRSIGKEMDFCTVHLHDGGLGWSMSVHPDGLFSNGVLEIYDDGRLELTILTTPEEAWKLGTEELDRVYAEIKKLTKKISEEELKRERDDEMRGLRKRIIFLEKNK